MPKNKGAYPRTKHHREIVADTFRTHGMSGSPTYRSWIAMLSRCRNPKRKSYARYGGRGITVCERWIKFENFLEDMGTRPTGTTLDRIKTSGNYCKENCQWRTPQQQCRNKGNNHLVTVCGITGCLKEVCEHFAVLDHYHSIKARINKLKWAPEKAILTIIRPKR